MGGRGADVALYAAMLILPLAALLARRPPMGQTLKMAAAWLGIFAIGLVVVSQRDRLSGVASLLSDQGVSGGETRIRMAGDGHFWADVSIQGVQRRMLIDSGATTTAISETTARAARIGQVSPFATILNTANGRVAARTGTASKVSVGNIEVTDLGVVISPAFGDTDVLGMNFLSRLSSWRVEGRTLILKP